MAQEWFEDIAGRPTVQIVRERGMLNVLVDGRLMESTPVDEVSMAFLSEWVSPSLAGVILEQVGSAAVVAGRRGPAQRYARGRRRGGVGRSQVPGYGGNYRPTSARPPAHGGNYPGSWGAVRQFGTKPALGGNYPSSWGPNRGNPGFGGGITRSQFGPRPPFAGNYQSSPMGLNPALGGNYPGSWGAEPGPGVTGSAAAMTGILLDNGEQIGDGDRVFHPHYGSGVVEVDQGVLIVVFDTTGEAFEVTPDMPLTLASGTVGQSSITGPRYGYGGNYRQSNTGPRYGFGFNYQTTGARASFQVGDFVIHPEFGEGQVDQEGPALVVVFSDGSVYMLADVAEDLQPAGAPATTGRRGGRRPGRRRRR